MQVYCFSVLLTWQVLTRCTSTRFSGLSTCSRWRLRTRFQPKNWTKGWRISTTTLRTRCMRMFADLFLKSINCYFRLCWLRKLSLERMSLIPRSGGTCLLVLEAKSRSSPTPPTGSQTAPGPTSTANSMAWPKSKNWKEFTSISWRKPMTLKKCSTAKSLMNKNFQLPGTQISINSKNSLS